MYYFEMKTGCLLRKQVICGCGSLKECAASLANTRPAFMAQRTKNQAGREWPSHDLCSQLDHAERTIRLAGDCHIQRTQHEWSVYAFMLAPSSSNNSQTPLWWAGVLLWPPLLHAVHHQDSCRPLGKKKLLYTTVYTRISARRLP